MKINNQIKANQKISNHSAGNQMKEIEKERVIMPELKKIRNDIWDTGFLDYLQKYSMKKQEHNLILFINLFGKRCFDRGKLEFQKQIKEIQGELETEFPCVMKIRKCDETNLDGSKKQIICSNCSFKFKMNELIKNKFGDLK